MREQTARENRVALHDGLILLAVDYLRALRIRRLAGRALDALLSSLDAIVAQTLARVAPSGAGSFPPYFVRDGVGSRGEAGNLCGSQATAVPILFGRASLAAGLDVLGRVDDDERILAVVSACQTRAGWHNWHPRQAAATPRAVDQRPRA